MEAQVDTTQRIARIIAGEIGATPRQVEAAVELLDGGATVPFVARYRKEATGGLDDTQLRKLADRLDYLRELEARRAAIVASIDEQGKLTDDLAAAVARAETKAELEDIYLPYKPKRRTKGMIAREAGLEPLVLQPKEGMALLNGTQVSTSLALTALIGARQALDSAVIIGALFITTRIVETRRWRA